MDPGMLNSRIVLKHIERTPDGSGGFEESCSAYATVWAKVVPRKQGTAWEGEDLIGVKDYDITIRFKRGVEFTDHVFLGDREFEQLAPPENVMEKNRYLKLMCREVLAHE